MADDRDRMGTTGSTGSASGIDWSTEDAYWQSNYSSRPYATADRNYGYYQPAYRYGTEAATRYRGRNWSDVESELRSGWDTYEHRGREHGQSTWENMKDAVRDAWDRVTGHHHGSR
ncbi:MAG TPA: hypothetical protein VFS08_12600 [Gemmatimonadaceae bacterium]|nr:hypothetical protein [Gemmatimonadaceae bacterium]